MRRSYKKLQQDFNRIVDYLKSKYVRCSNGLSSYTELFQITHSLRSLHKMFKYHSISSNKRNKGVFTKSGVFKW